MRHAHTASRFLAAGLLALAVPAACLAQSSTDALVIGGYRETGFDDYEDNTTFTCRGYPTCVGTYTSTVRGMNCPNTYTFGGDLVITGLDLSRSGSIGGTYTVTPGFVDTVQLPGGTCVAGQASAPATYHFAGTWDATTGTGTVSALGIDAPVNFRADVNAPPPVFPMAVRSRIDAQTATASASILYRAQDVGTTGGVFVFAVAPSGQVKGGGDAKAVRVGFAKATVPGAEKAESCVIAQLSPSTGQLVAVTAAQMQAFLSGTLSAQGASVAILDNTPTPSVAGATFYVGYGPSGSTMLSGGVFRNAVLVPGSGVCPPLPSQTALWWNPAESGWGLNLNQQGSTVFATLFTYDERRVPLWLVMSNGVMQSDGVTFTGTLYRTTGPAFNADPFTPIGAGNLSNMGTMTVSFVDANSATLEYVVGGSPVRKSIQRQVFGSRAANCLPTADSRTAATNYQDLWWNPAESGWGINVTHQDDTLFATLFTYDATGRDLWLVMSSGTKQADGSYLGDLYRTTGPAFNAVPFTPIGAGDITTVGTMRLAFSDGVTGTLTYTYNGVTVNKAITRQVFATPQPLCN